MFYRAGPRALRLSLICAALAAAALAGCEGDMVRDAGGGQDDSSTPGRPADDGGIEAGAGDAEADAADAACVMGDGAADGACDGGPDDGDGGGPDGG